MKTIESGTIARRRSRDGDRALPKMMTATPSTASAMTTLNATTRPRPTGAAASMKRSPFAGQFDPQRMNGPPAGSVSDIARISAQRTATAAM